MKKMLLAAVAAVAMAGVTPALAADNYLFGFSPFGVQTLTLNGNITLQAIDTGWIRSDGVHTATNNNYIVGDCDACGGFQYNDYFHFDLSNLGVEVTSAVLSVGNGNGYAAGPLSTWSLFDVNNSLASLDVNRNSGDAGGLGLFSDLQSGVLYGARGITNVVQNSQVDISLNGAALAAINRAAGGEFAIGGTLRPGEEIPGGIPEPATWALMIGGFGLAGASLRRRRSALA